MWTLRSWTNWCQIEVIYRTKKGFQDYQNICYLHSNYSLLAFFVFAIISLWQARLLQLGVSNQTLLDETCGQMTYSNVQCWVETNLVFRFLGVLYISQVKTSWIMTMQPSRGSQAIRISSAPRIFAAYSRVLARNALLLDITRNLCLKLSLLSGLRCTS